jgi:hypothetical protein
MEKQWKIENKTLQFYRHTERLANTANELEDTGRNQNQCGYGGKRTTDNALQKVNYHTASKQSLTYLSHLCNTQDTR